MNRSRVSLYEFVPYGAPELLEVRESYLTRALATASSGLILLFALAIGVSAWIAGHAGERVVPLDRVVVLGPPPVLDRPHDLPPAARTPHVSRPSDAVPKLVPDEVAPLDNTIASQDELSRVGPVDDHGQVGGETAVPPVIDPTPGMNDFVYYDEPPAVVTRVVPEYPEIAHDAGVEGTVQLRLLVGTDGRVKDVHVDRSVPMLDGAAVAAARQWVFTPAISSGHPVAVWVAVPVRFSLH
jgi:protein TonB